MFEGNQQHPTKQEITSADWFSLQRRRKNGVFQKKEEKPQEEKRKKRKKKLPLQLRAVDGRKKNGCKSGVSVLNTCNVSCHKPESQSWAHPTPGFPLVKYDRTAYENRIFKTSKSGNPFMKVDLAHQNHYQVSSAWPSQQMNGVFKNRFRSLSQGNIFNREIDEQVKEKKTRSRSVVQLDNQGSVIRKYSE